MKTTDFIQIGKISSGELKVMLCFNNLPLAEVIGLDFSLFFLALAEQESQAKTK